MPAYALRISVCCSAVCSSGLSHPATGAVTPIPSAFNDPENPQTFASDAKVWWVATGDDVETGAPVPATTNGSAPQIDGGQGTWNGLVLSATMDGGEASLFFTEGNGLGIQASSSGGSGSSQIDAAKNEMLTITFPEPVTVAAVTRSEEHTYELKSLMRKSYGLV